MYNFNDSYFHVDCKFNSGRPNFNCFAWICSVVSWDSLVLFTASKVISFYITNAIY